MPPLVFDLDGTISNPAVGFARSINFALGAFGYPAIDEEDVSQYIGPPLEASIRRMAPGASAAAERAGRTSLVRVMSDPVDDLIIDLLEWIGPEARAYGEVMDAWRTSCPRLPVWEEANDRGFVERQHRDGIACMALLLPINATALSTRRSPDM